MYTLGLSFNGDRANFALFSTNGPLFLALLRDGKEELIPMEQEGQIWHVSLPKIAPNTSYCFQVGEKKWADLYAKEPIDFIWAHARPIPPFDWQGVKSPEIRRENLILCEMHVRGFTRHTSSGVKFPGTYLGVIEKIPFLKKLGINAVELLPIFEFDEARNYWGYNPIHFFAPQKWYAVKNPIEEFKTMVRELHRNGIEVILDVVYNHTDEKHMAEKVYYMVDEKGNYIDFTGCHNTLNVNHPVVQKLILDSLHYWAEEMGVDGFRFDLAAVFPSTLTEAISKNFPHKKLIAEPWDAAGRYQLGRFFPWSEWDDQYRDGIRRFIKGTGGWPVSPAHNIHFVTAHDGYTLRDLVSYQQKHNEANGEGNRDGSNHNESWNCGVEGPTNDPAICALRERQMRNFWVALLTTKGIPQILIEDVYGHTRKGNNNPYNQDNELNWFLWDHLEPKMFRFISSLISLRKDLSKLHAHFNNTHVPSQISVPEGRWRIAVLTAEDWEFHEEGDDVQKVTLAPYSSVLLYSKF